MRERQQNVSAIMSREVVAVPPDTSLTEAARILREHQFNGIPVVDDRNVLFGILTEYDLITKGSTLHLPTLQRLFQKLPVVSVNHFQKELQKLSQLTVKDVMNREPLTVRLDASIEDIVRIFIEHHRVNPIPVIDHFRRVVGIVSRSDILKFFAAVPSHAEESHLGTRVAVPPSEILAERAISFLQNDYVLVNKLIENGHDWLQENQMLFQALSTATTESKDFVSALRMIVQKICEFSDWAVGEAWMLDAKKEKLVLESVWHRDVPSLREFAERSRSFTFGLGEGFPGRAWNLRQPVWARDVAKEEKESFLRNEEAQRAGLHAGLAVPVIIVGNVVAVVLFFMQEVSRTDERFVEFVSSVVTHLDVFLGQKFSQDTEHIFRQSLEAATDAIMITTPGAIVIYVNPAWERLNGYRFQEVRGKNANIIKSEKTPREIYGRLWKTITSGKAFRTDQVVNRRKDGTEYCEELTISPISHDGVISFYMGVTRDVTKRKEAERAQGEIISLTAHQIKAPLTLIGWNVDSLMREKLGKEREEYLKEIFTAGKTMSELVDTFLNSAKLEAGTMVPHPVPLDVIEYAERSVKQIMPFAEKKRISVEKHFAGGLPKVTLDPIALGIVLQNYLSNAVKYAPEEGAVTLEVGEADGRLVIRVMNTGPGIPKDEQPKLFTKLFRASNVQQKEGTGLGLYIAKMAVERSGGSVGCISKEGTGPTFWASFPLASAAR